MSNEKALVADLDQTLKCLVQKDIFSGTVLLAKGNRVLYQFGMLLLGVIIEKVSGQNYFDYVQENIYKPAGMEGSALRTFGGKEPGVINPDGGIKSQQAVGYIPKIDGSYEAVFNSAYTIGSPAGGGYSTVVDLHKFGVALLSRKLLTDSSKLKMFKDELGNGYGYGFQLMGSGLRQGVGHSGGAPGVNAQALFFPHSEYMIIVLSNYDRGTAYLGEYLLSQLRSIRK